MYFKSLILCITCITRSSFFLWLCTLMQHACQHLITNHQPTHAQPQLGYWVLEEPHIIHYFDHIVKFFLWLWNLMQHACQHLITNHQPNTCTPPIRILSWPLRGTPSCVLIRALFYALLWSHSQVFSLTMDLDATCMPTSHHKSPLSIYISPSAPI